MRLSACIVESITNTQARCLRESKQRAFSLHHILPNTEIDKKHGNKEILPDRASDAHTMVQHRGRHAQQTAAAAASRDQAARDEGADERHLRRRTDRPGDVDGAFHRHPRRGAGDLQDMAAFAAGARHGTGKSPRHPGKDLFQERKRIARRVAQAQHRRAAGLLQLQAGHTPPDDRNGRRAVGRGHRLRSQALRARRTGFHGEGQLRTETLPAADDEHVGRRVHRVAQHDHRLAARRSNATRTAREASGWRSRRPWRWLCNTRRTPATAWAAC